MNCTSHSIALMLEFQLSAYFREKTLVDVDDLWEKQKKFGTASEAYGDYSGGPFIVGSRYGVRFRTESGKTGTIFLPKKGQMENGIKHYHGGTIKMDKPYMRIFDFLKRKKKQVSVEGQNAPNNAAMAYKHDVDSLIAETRHTLNKDSKYRLTVEVEQLGIGADAYSSIENVPDVQIDFRDRAREDVEFPKIDERHRDLLNARGPIGAGGVPYWEVLNPLEHAIVISAHFLLPWIFKHVAEDFDQKVWNAVKQTVTNLVCAVLHPHEELRHRDIVVRMHYPDQIQHEVALIFSSNLNEEQINNAFERIKEATENLPEPKQPGPSLKIFWYSPDEQKWIEDKTSETR